MNQPANLDVSKISFDRFVEFFFNHPESEPFWYADQEFALSDVSFPAPLLVDHLTRLFSDFGAVTARYSPAQVGHGIWAMFSPSFSLTEVLWDGSIPLEKRIDCLKAMGQLFKTFVPANDAEPLQKCFYMWWHIVVTGFWIHAGQFETPDLAKLDAESTSLLQAIFETVSAILEVPDPRTQGYALHGLGHLQDPRVHALVQNYLDRNKEKFTDEHVHWIEQCRDGVVS